MKHAGAAALARIEPLLADLRLLGGLRERRPGIFYRGAHAWLHFHEHGPELWADLKRDGQWLRLPAGSVPEQQAVLQAVRTGLADQR